MALNGRGGHPAADCQLCPLAQTRTKVVWGRGDERAKIMIVGEAPGANEDKAGRPFVGRSGQLLDQLMREAGVDKNPPYITNTVKCRPPDNRRPMPRELEACENWLQMELDQVHPVVVVLMGKTATDLAFPWEKRVPAGQARALELFGHHVVAIATYHPAAALRNRPLTRVIVRDLRRAKALAASI